MSKNVVENNNSFVDFSQVWSDFVFVDPIPDEAPSVKDCKYQIAKENPDKSIYTESYFQIVTDNKEYDYLIYVSNFQLTKEFRQAKVWKFEWNKDEESIRRLILPGTTASRSYVPKFTNGEIEIPYTSVDPNFDFENCRITTGLNFDKLYFTGWLYVGKTIKSVLDDELKLPFNNKYWLLKDLQTGKKVRFEIRKENVYILPGDSFEDDMKVDDNVIVTTNILNQVSNLFLSLDQGEYW